MQVRGHSKLRDEFEATPEGIMREVCIDVRVWGVYVCIYVYACMQWVCSKVSIDLEITPEGIMRAICGCCM